MENGHPVRNFVLVVVGLFVAGAVAWWLLKVVLSVAFALAGYLIVGAIMVGGGVYLYGRAKRAVNGGGRRRIGR